LLAACSSPLPRFGFALNPNGIFMEESFRFGNRVGLDGIDSLRA
jgi:hypothetical protein